MSLYRFYSGSNICMAFPVVEFSREGYKIRKVFGKKSTVFKWNYQILKIWVMGSCQKVPKFDFQSQFSMSKIIRIFLNFFHRRISNKEHICCYWHFLIKSIFKCLLKWCPIFDSWPLNQFSKFNNFLWAYWFLGKNLSNF